MYLQNAFRKSTGVTINTSMVEHKITKITPYIVVVKSDFPFQPFIDLWLSRQDHLVPRL